MSCVWVLLSILTYGGILYLAVCFKYYKIMSDVSDQSSYQGVPHITFRSSLARALYEQIENDDRLRNTDRTKWYSLDKTGVSEQMLNYFVQLSEDDDTEDFYCRCEAKNQQFFVQLLHTLTKPIFSLFASQTSINGLFKRGSMFLLSATHMKHLLREEADTYKPDKMLDLGAGDGCVTDHLATFAQQVFVTEMSPIMKWRLRQKSYTVVGVDEWQEERYDLITCLNLLDRCDQPLTLLKQIKESLTPNGLLLVAVVLPFSPYVEYSSDHNPMEFLDVKGDTMEEQSEMLYKKVLKPAGFSLVSFSKLPYLCEGDFYQTFYYLQDLVMLLKHAPSSSNSSY